MHLEGREETHRHVGGGQEKVKQTNKKNHRSTHLPEVSSAPRER